MYIIYYVVPWYCTHVHVCFVAIYKYRECIRTTLVLKTIGTLSGCAICTEWFAWAGIGRDSIRICCRRHVHKLTNFHSPAHVPSIGVMVNVRMVKCAIFSSHFPIRRVWTLLVTTVCIGHMVWFLTWEIHTPKRTKCDVDVHVQFTC